MATAAPPVPPRQLNPPAACLLLDWGEKALSAWLVEASGTVFPCSITCRERTWRFFSTSLWIAAQNSGVTASLENDAFVEKILRFMRRSGRNWAEIGWMHPWEIESRQEAIPVEGYLEALGFATGSSDREITRWLRQAVGAMAGFTLEPVFDFLSFHGLPPARTEVLLAVPGRLSRQARLLLRQVLCRHGFRDVRLVDRVLAAAMGGLETPAAAREVWVTEVLAKRSFLYRIRRFGDAGELRLESDDCREIPAFGWEFLVRNCLLNNVLPDKAGSRGDQWTTVERLLLGSLGFAFAPPEGLPALTRTRLKGLWQEVFRPAFDGLAIPRLVEGAEKRPAVFVPLGEVFFLADFERDLAERLGLPLAGWTRDCLPPDRALAGLLGLWRWMIAHPEGEVVLQRNPSLRLGTEPNESCLLVPPDAMPRPGERRVIRQVLALASADGRREGRMPLAFQCGEAPHPTACSPVGLLNIAVREEDFARQRRLRLELHLSRPRDGERVGGRAFAFLGDQTAEGALEFPETLVRLKTRRSSQTTTEATAR